MRRAFHLILLLLIPITFTGCFEKRETFVLKDIRTAPDHLSEARLRFQGVPHVGKGGEYVWRSGSASSKSTPNYSPKQWRYVVPVTGSDWDASQPVPLWISFSTNKRDIRSRLSGLASALRRGSIEGKVMDFPTRTVGVFRGTSAWQNAVADAEKKHGIQSHPKAPIITWDQRR